MIICFPVCNPPISLLFHFLLLQGVLFLVVSTGRIWWILWFSVRYAAAARREIFGVNALRGKQQQLGSPNLQDIFIGGVSFSGKENSLILKNKMAATGISLKIIYIFLLAVPHR